MSLIVNNIMKRKLIEDDHTVKKPKNNYESIVAFECNCELFCYPCNDTTIRSITLLVSTKGEKKSYQFSTYNSDNTEKDVLTKSLNILNDLKSFKLVGYGIAMFDLKLIASKCDKYKLEYKNLFSENTIDLHAEIPKYIKLQRYRLQDVTNEILNKELNIIVNEEQLDLNATKHCELYLELIDSLNLLAI